MAADWLGGLAWQALIIALLVGLGWLAVRNGMANLQASGLSSGFGFLQRSAGFDIAETAIVYSPDDSNGRVFLIGALNTLRVTGLGVLLATMLGVGFGAALRSVSPGLRTAAATYVELTRNIPLPILLLITYSVLAMAPPPRDAIDLGGLGFVSNRGLYLARLEWRVAPATILAGLALAAAFLIAVWRWPRPRMRPLWLSVLVALIVVVGLGLSVKGLDRPHLQGFGFVGGLVISPPLLALVGALSLYSGGYIAEVVRGGLAAVDGGQIEAARAVGLTPLQTLRWVTLPQALRVAAPPLVSQYLNLAKNASLAIVVGYPDLVALFGGTVLNQTGQAAETLAMVFGFYLALSLVLSALVNLWAARQSRWAVR